MTCWSLNDKRIQRIVGYLKSTSDYSHVMKISNSPSELSLSLYCDANFGGDLKDMKSTSGFVLPLKAQDLLLCWDGVARSLTRSFLKLLDAVIWILDFCALPFVRFSG